MPHPSRAEEGRLLWEPPPDAYRRSRLAEYSAWLERELGVGPADYDQLWEWSTTSVDAFWGSIWDYFGVVGDRGRGPVLAARTMPGASWFEGATLNYAANALKFAHGPETALRAYSELAEPRLLSARDLRLQVGSVAAYLRRTGVGVGDRVAAFLPNIPQAVIAFLATASLGAIWSSCSPDFGEQAVLDRFQQIHPKVLFAVDGYRYGGRDYDRRQLVHELSRRLPSLEAVVTVPHLFEASSRSQGEGPVWDELVGDPQEPAFEEVGFDHPLWILYSSGTTGLPKAIVQSHGGIVLEHLKVLALHADLGPGDRSFWFTTTGWMMWNYLIGGLLVGASLVLFDGSPGEPDLGRLWELAAEAGVTHFGTSAAHLGACMKQGVNPRARFDLTPMRFLGSTGSPLSPEAYAWVYQDVKSEIWLASLSGGTDLCTAFVLGCPGMPVRAGVIQCRALGARVEAFDVRGDAVLDRVGELVIREPMPSMPVFLWGDPKGRRYWESYFETFPGVWRHGDWLRIRADGGVVIYGRSDSTINRHGVRMGTSEIYRVVEARAEIADSLVVDVARPEGDSLLALFVAIAPGARLTEGLITTLQNAIRTQVSPRHVPDLIQQVRAIPRTLSGKKLEVPVKRILEGEAAAQVLDLDSVADPESLAPFMELARTLPGTRAAGTSG